MPTICPNCGSEHTATFRSVYESGTSTSTLTGTIVGQDTYARVRASGTQVSRLADECAPPRFKTLKDDHWGYGVFALLALIFTISANSGHPMALEPARKAADFLRQFINFSDIGLLLLFVLKAELWTWPIQVVFRLALFVVVSAVVLLPMTAGSSIGENFAASLLGATAFWSIAGLGQVKVNAENVAVAEDYAKWETAWKCLRCGYGFYAD